MIAVIFEVRLKPGKKPHYLDIAASLRPLLEQIDGFISVERFQSLGDAGKVLSLSFFRDEAAISEWRNLEKHRAAQLTGRSEVFDDYRLRVAHVVRDYGMNERAEVPENLKTNPQQGS